MIFSDLLVFGPIVGTGILFFISLMMPKDFH